MSASASAAPANGADEPVTKKAKTSTSKLPPLTKQDTIYFDPTSIGLPKNWSLTDYSDLKG